MTRASPARASATFASATASAPMSWISRTGGPVPDAVTASSTPAPSISVAMSTLYHARHGRVRRTVRRSRRAAAPSRGDGRADAGPAAPGLGRQRDRPRGADDGGRDPAPEPPGHRRAAGRAGARRDGHALPRGGHAGARGAPGPPVGGRSPFLHRREKKG